MHHIAQKQIFFKKLPELDPDPNTDPDPVAGVYILVRKRYLFPPPSENDIFSPSRESSFFDSQRGLFALILPYFAFILPFNFLCSHFLSSFFIFLSPFPFSFTLLPLLISLFSYFFPKMTSADIFYPPLGWGVFSNRPLSGGEISGSGKKNSGSGSATLTVPVR
jgi:hypothetical protein